MNVANNRSMKAIGMSVSSLQRAVTGMLGVLHQRRIPPTIVSRALLIAWSAYGIAGSSQVTHKSRIQKENPIGSPRQHMIHSSPEQQVGHPDHGSMLVMSICNDDAPHASDHTATGRILGKLHVQSSPASPAWIR